MLSDDGGLEVEAVPVFVWLAWDRLGRRRRRDFDPLGDGVGRLGQCDEDDHAEHSTPVSTT